MKIGMILAFIFARVLVPAWGQELGKFPKQKNLFDQETLKSLVAEAGEIISSLQVAQKQYSPLPDQFQFDSTDVDLSFDTNAVDLQWVVNSVLGVPGAEDPGTSFTTTDVNYSGSRDALDIQSVVNLMLGVSVPPDIEIAANDPDFNFDVGQEVIFSASGGGGNWDLNEAGYFWFSPQHGPQWGTDQVPFTFSIPGEAHILFAVVQRAGDSWGIRT